MCFCFFFFPSHLVFEFYVSFVFVGKETRRDQIVEGLCLLMNVINLKTIKGLQAHVPFLMTNNHCEMNCKNNVEKKCILCVGNPLLLVNNRCMSNDEGCNAIDFHPKVTFVDCLNNASIEII